MRISDKIVLGAMACALLSACGGGGGGGVNSTPTPAPTTPTFTSFGAAQPSTQVSLNGTSREGAMSIPSNGGIVLGYGNPPTETTGTINVSLNGSKQISGVSIKGSQSTIDLSASISNNQSVLAGATEAAKYVYSSDGSDRMMINDPISSGFNYQTFGVWATGLQPGRSANYGAISAGAKTSAVPSSGSAIFNGYAIGFVSQSTLPWIQKYAAKAQFTVNFTNRCHAN